MWNNYTVLLLAENAGETFTDGLLQVLSYIGGAIGAVFALWAFYLFFLMSTASDETKRKTAKRRIIMAVSTILAVAALVTLLQIIKVNIGTAPDPEEDGGIKKEDPLYGATLVTNTIDITRTGTGDYNYYYKGQITLAVKTAKGDVLTPISVTTKGLSQTSAACFTYTAPNLIYSGPSNPFMVNGDRLTVFIIVYTVNYDGQQLTGQTTVNLAD